MFIIVFSYLKETNEIIWKLFETQMMHAHVLLPSLLPYMHHVHITSYISFYLFQFLIVLPTTWNAYNLHIWSYVPICRVEDRLNPNYILHFQNLIFQIAELERLQHADMVSGDQDLELNAIQALVSRNFFTSTMIEGEASYSQPEKKFLHLGYVFSNILLYIYIDHYIERIKLSFSVYLFRLCHAGELWEKSVCC